MFTLVCVVTPRPSGYRNNSVVRPGQSCGGPEQVHRGTSMGLNWLGGEGITTPSARTAEQTDIALFWLESSPCSGTGSPRRLSRGRLDPAEDARCSGCPTWPTTLHGHSNQVPGVQLLATRDRHCNPEPTATRTRAPDQGLDFSRADPPSPTRLGTQRRGGRQLTSGAVLGAHRVTFETCSRRYRLEVRVNTCRRVPFVHQLSEARKRTASAHLVGFHFRKAVDEGIKHGRKSATRRRPPPAARNRELTTLPSEAR